MALERFAAQVVLLVRLLPVIAAEDVFALKGGTAINLFYRAMPRLSVDIDLTYLPVQDRATSLAGIDNAMDRISDAINKLDGISARRISGGGGAATRIQARNNDAIVKIETSPVTRGCVFTPQLKRVSKVVEETYGFAEMLLVPFEDLFAGKLCAALDRQHPRDLFDVKLLFENEGLTDTLFRAFLVYAASSPRPMHELLNPHLRPLDEVFETEFLGISNEDVEIGVLEDVRETLISEIQARLTGKTAEFLLSLQAGAPDFGLIDLPEALNLPAVQWKLRNLHQLKANDPAKHSAQTRQLQLLLQM